ncbi:hypothetical protein [Nocardia terpenica]|uniref:Uncharacterized protein n=1 Tax=Nocardia terpenica TaxID=455432 RepID=A0A164PHI4_9NOCA|nr:hypothetical protein [Nocardia terpenica]KZM75578.1 hypothetical protein AWN90_19590 [Nocardia terpenica]NQE86062.1 hypothetical protein [Nocardia terpenica]
MKLLYTAAWTDHAHDALTSAMAAFTTWVAAEASVNRFITARQQFSRPDPDEYSASLVELRSGNAIQRTRLWAVQDRRQSGTLSTTISVEVRGEGRSCAAPSIVASLIDHGLRPSVGEDLLSTTPRYVAGASAGEQLAEQVSAFDRRVPIVVMMHIPDLFTRLRRSASGFGTIANSTAAAIAGVANVVVADADSVAGFNAALGPDHAIRPGHLRIFRPGVDPAVDGEHANHPWLSPGRWYADEYLAPRYVARRTVTPHTAVPRHRRAPELV